MKHLITWSQKMTLEDKWHLVKYGRCYPGYFSIKHLYKCYILPVVNLPQMQWVVTINVCQGSGLLKSEHSGRKHLHSMSNKVNRIWITAITFFTAVFLFLLSIFAWWCVFFIVTHMIGRRFTSTAKNSTVNWRV